MKQFRFLFMVLAMLLSVACNTDDNAVVGIMDDYPSESLPVNDLMTVTTDVPVTILDSDYSDVIDGNSYPMIKTVTLGMNLKF